MPAAAGRKIKIGWDGSNKGEYRNVSAKFYAVGIKFTYEKYKASNRTSPNFQKVMPDTLSLSIQNFVRTVPMSNILN